MSKFKCLNKNCSQYNKIELIPSVRFMWNSETYKLEALEGICSQCGKMRETVKEGSITKMPWFKADNDRNNDNKRIKKYS